MKILISKAISEICYDEVDASFLLPIFQIIDELDNEFMIKYMIGGVTNAAITVLDRLWNAIENS